MFTNDPASVFFNKPPHRYPTRFTRPTFNKAIITKAEKNKQLADNKTKKRQPNARVTRPKQTIIVPPLPKEITYPRRKIRILELFKGTGSVGRTFMERYRNDNIYQQLFDPEVVSLDWDRRIECTHNMDIMQFDYKNLYHNKENEGSYFDMIWASPDCRIFSQLQCSWINRKNGVSKWRDREQLEEERRNQARFVRRVLQIIAHYKPRLWIIENPFYSAMCKIPEMAMLNSFRKDYCAYGFSYRKPTRLWSEANIGNTRCSCGPLIMHESTQLLPKSITHRIPPELLEEIFDMLDTIPHGHNGSENIINLLNQSHIEY